MIDTQEKLNEIVNKTLIDANEKTKEFPLYEDVDLSRLPYEIYSQNFETEKLHDDFISKFCDGKNSLIGEALYNYITRLYSKNNKIKNIDYLSENDIKEIENLNPKYSFGKFIKADCHGYMPGILEDIKEIHDPYETEEDNDYVVLIKDEESAKICFEFSNNFKVNFCRLAYTKDDLKAYPYIIEDGHFESSKNDDELLNAINTYMCNLSFGVRYSSCVDEDGVIVYKVNRSSRSKVLSAKIVK